MNITIECTHCHKKYDAPAKFAGKRVKCKHCAQVFAIPADAVLEEGLAASAPAPVAVPPPPARQSTTPTPFAKKPAAGKLGDPSGGFAVQVERAGDVDEIDVDDDAPVRSGLRPSIMLDFPGADVIEQVAPLLLVVLGLGWIVFAASQSNNTGVGWVSAVRISMYLGAFFLIVLPISLAAIGWASRKLRFALPPAAFLRGMGCFALPFAIAVALWLGNESMGGLVFGAVLGGIVACAAVWFLYRLQPLEMGTTLGAAMGGFIGSTLVAYFVFMGANMIFQSSGAQVSSSPVGPSFAWTDPTRDDKPTKTIAKATNPIGTDSTNTTENPKLIPAPPVNTNNHNPTPPPATQTTATQPATKPVEVVHPNPTPPTIDTIPKNTDPQPTPPTELKSTSPFITQLTPFEPGEFNELFFTAMPSNFAAFRRAGETPGDSVEVWTLNPPAKRYDPVTNPEKGPAKMILSPNGELIGRVTTWPKLAVQVYSIPAQKVVRTIDLSVQFGTPELLGFGANDSVIIHWNKDNQHGIEVYATKGPATASPQRLAQFNIDAYESTPGNPSISPDGKLLAIAAVNSQKGGIHIYDLNSSRKGPLRTYFPPLVAWVKPSGMTFSPDSKTIAAFFENEGKGLLVHARVLDAKSIHEHIFPILPVAATVKDKWGSGRSLDFLAEGQEWLLYGQVLIDVETGTPIGTLDLPDPKSQRIIDRENVMIQATLDEKPRMAIVKLKADTIAQRRAEARKKP